MTGAGGGETRPSSGIVDLRGVPIEPGSRVAFNRSGDVALGTVHEVVASRLDPELRYGRARWARRPKIRIVADAPWRRGRGRSKPSEVVVWDVPGEGGLVRVSKVTAV